MGDWSDEGEDFDEPLVNLDRCDICGAVLVYDEWLDALVCPEGCVEEGWHG